MTTESRPLMSQSERRKAIKKFVIANPEMTDMQIATFLRCRVSTVGLYRRQSRAGRGNCRICQTKITQESRRRSYCSRECYLTSNRQRSLDKYYQEIRDERSLKQQG